MFNTLSFRAQVLIIFFKIIARKNFLFDPAIQEFEKKLASFLDTSHALGVASGTDALILSLKALGIGPGNEVIVPAFSFFSTAGVVPWVGAKPVFVDVERDSLNINPGLIERAITPKTKAVIAAHFNGRMADMEAICAVAKKHKLFVVEDAAQAIGAKYKNKPVGYYGDVVCLSFNPMKLLGGYGDGGAVVTGNDDIARKVYLMRTYGARFGEICSLHPIVGVSSRLSAFQAAVLSLKIERMDEVLEFSRRSHAAYAERVKSIPGIRVQNDPPPDYFINGNRSIIFTPRRDDLIKYLRGAGVSTGRPYAAPLPYLEALNGLGYKKGDFPVAEKAADELLVLPGGAWPSEKEMARVTRLIKSFFGVS